MHVLPSLNRALLAAGLALATSLAGATAASADAATAELGAAAEIRAGELPAPVSSGGVVVQITEASSSYAVPAGYSTITAWSHSAGGTAGALSFKVYRPTGRLREFTVVASDTRQVVANAVQTFAVRIAVQPGDRLGLSSDDVELAYETFLPADRIGFFGAELMPDVPRMTDGDPFEQFKLDVSATLESDRPAQPGSPPSSVPPPSASYPLAPPVPVLRRLAISPRAFAAARAGGSVSTVRRRGSGATVSYSLDTAASVRFAVQRVLRGRRRGRGTNARCVAPTRVNRRAARCTRHRSVKGAIERTSRAGASSFYVTGRLGGRRLARGSYRLMATPAAGGLSGASLSRTFRITR